jgi:hypothetical protein
LKFKALYNQLETEFEAEGFSEAFAHVLDLDPDCEEIIVVQLDYIEEVNPDISKTGNGFASA